MTQYQLHRILISGVVKEQQLEPALRVLKVTWALPAPPERPVHLDLKAQQENLVFKETQARPGSPVETESKVHLAILVITVSQE